MAQVGQRGIICKSPREVELMRSAGALVHRVLVHVGEMVRPGITTAELNDVAERMIAEAGADPLFKGVTNPAAKIPFPGALCVSIDEEVVHGLPSDRALVEGQIVSVDCGVRLNGYCGDAAMTFMVGQVAQPVRQLLEATRQALEIAIAEIRVGRMWSEVAALMQQHVEQNGFSMVRDYVGHGIGTQMHEEPKVPNYVDAHRRQLDFKLVEGMVLAIEPMVNLGGLQVKCTGPYGWTVTTRDGQCSAHFEHTVAVRADGADVLTDGRPSRFDV